MGRSAWCGVGTRLGTLADFPSDPGFGPQRKQILAWAGGAEAAGVLGEDAPSVGDRLGLAWVGAAKASAAPSGRDISFVLKSIPPRCESVLWRNCSHWLPEGGLPRPADFRATQTSEEAPCSLRTGTVMSLSSLWAPHPGNLMSPRGRWHMSDLRLRTQGAAWGVPRGWACMQGFGRDLVLSKLPKLASWPDPRVCPAATLALVLRRCCLVCGRR